ncbi:hypothetical protein [Klebsiella pneumoniae]|uniref:hypothetical protein n=1 Tax=Klebsiella pneumoniae TaxID=573 RepID=UPI000E2CD1DC|nr:hypothetical protein [Klebsiella pneumoniae]SYF74480.1 Uncharacterised protein [Klebsiella pneumoniae]
MENQFEIKADEGVSNDRLQEAINSMSFWGSTTGIELDEIIMVFSEALRNRRAKQSEDIVHSGRLPVEHIGYVTRDRKMMIFKDSPNMLPEDVSTLDKLVVLSGQLIKPEEDILSENVALKAELESACGFSVDTPLTDRRLLAVRADGVDEYAALQDAVAEKYAKSSPGCYGEESARYAATSARKFSQNLRKNG